MIQLLDIEGQWIISMGIFNKPLSEIGRSSQQNEVRIPIELKKGVSISGPI